MRCLRPLLTVLATVLALRLALMAPLTAEEPSGVGDPDIHAILVQALHDHPVPALGAAVVRSHLPALIGVAGVRKRGDPTPVTVADCWHLGSCTKAMTAVLAARLIVRGDLGWTTTLEEGFPELRSGMLPGWPGTTLTALLTHRSGAPANLPWSTVSDRLAAVRLATASPPHSPGSYLYSNTGYVLAGALIERAGHASWESLMTREVWQPLGMTGGFGGMGTVGLTDQPWGHDTDGRVAGNGPPADNPEVMGPAGRVHMTLSDWSRFIADQLRGERNEPALLPSAAYHQLHEPYPVVPGADDPHYACGWEVVDRDWGHGRVWTHNGTNTMHYAVVWMAPAIDLAVLVVCNQGGTAAACDAVAAQLIRSHTR